MSQDTDRTSDFADLTREANAESSATEFLDSRTQSPDAEAFKEAIEQHQSPIGPDKEKLEEAARESEMSQMQADADAQDRNTDLQKQFRLQQLKSSDDVKRNAHRFFMDMAGIQAFDMEYQINPWIKVRFQTPTAELSEEISRQNIRDLIVGRMRFTNEARFVHIYRLAASLVYFEFNDPQNPKKPIKIYDAKESNKEILALELDGDEFLVDSDMFLRRRALYLLKSVFTTPIYQLILPKYSEFEGLVNDMLFIAEEDSDFFLQCLTEAC